MQIKNLSINKPLIRKKIFFSQLCFKINNQNLPPLKSDTISFGSNLKKTDFKGLDRVAIETFKINPQQLKTKDDLQKVAKEKIKAITEKDYGGRSEEIKVQRKAMLKEWFQYVIEENDAYSSTQQLIILSEITKDLKNNNDNTPPVLNKGVLADVVDGLEKELEKTPGKEFNFSKIYQNKMRTSYIQDLSTGETMTGWVLIPSKKNNLNNFKSNVEKLKALSYKTWCTKSFNAEPYLAKGDFHVYLENGQPKLGVRFDEDVVVEIQGEKNNSEIPIEFLDIFNAHQKECKLKLTHRVKNEVDRAEEKKAKVAEIKKKLSSAIELKTINDAEKIFNCLGIKAEKCETSDSLIIDSYRILNEYSFGDLGIDEKKLFKFVHKIKHSADFSNSQITNLGNLKLIGGDVDFWGSKIINLGNLKSIGGDADFRFSQITNLGNLKSIGGFAYFGDSQITSLGNLETIGGDVDFRDSQITNLGNLKSIGGFADFRYSQITNLGNLKSIGGFADFKYSQITNLGNLETIGGDVNFDDSKLICLGNLETIGGDADFRDSHITSLAKLKLIDGDVYLSSKLTRKDFKNIKIKGKIIGKL